MKRMQFILALALAGSMGSAAASTVGPGYLGDLVGQNVSIAHTVSGLGTPIVDVYGFDIGSFASEAIATSVKVQLQFGSGSTPVYDISNFAITAYDGDSASARAYVIGLGLQKSGAQITVHGRYYFDVVRTHAGWKARAYRMDYLMPLPDTLAAAHADH